MEAVYSSETLVSNFKTHTALQARRQIHRCNNLKSD
jgi:hypothetical protein